MLLAIATLAALAVADHPAGSTWTVRAPRLDGTVDTVEINAPLPVADAMIPLPLSLRLRGRGPVDVEVCESDQCLLPTQVTLTRDGDRADLDALLVDGVPLLRLNGVPQERLTRHRAGRALAFAGPAPHELAFPSTSPPKDMSSANVVMLDAGTLLQERPELLDALGGVIFDDGVPATLASALLRFVRNGGVASVVDADAQQLGLGTNGTLAPRVDLPSEGSWQTAVIRRDDRLVTRIDNRIVALPLVDDDALAIGSGLLVLRKPGESEAARVAGVLRARPDFALCTSWLTPTNHPALVAAEAGLQPRVRLGPALGGVVVVMIVAGAVLLWSFRRRDVSVVRASARAVVVCFVGLAGFLGVRLATQGDREMRTAAWAAGENGRRVVRVLARAPGAFGSVSLPRDALGGPMTTVQALGPGSQRVRVAAVQDRVEARLSSANGLAGTRFTHDSTPGVLRLRGSVVENGLPFPLRFAVVRRDPDPGGRDLWVLRDLPPGAKVSLDEAVATARYGSVVEERLARETLGRVGVDVVGIAEVDGFVTAIEATR